jgi:beta-phosphoglucomutase-like phosphatase (HAD superfamily)
VPLAGSGKPRPRLVVFDFDRAVIDPRAAWRYCIEESVTMVTGERPRVETLVEEYHLRPWRQALSVVVGDRAAVRRCEELCEQMFTRSAMKRLLVHEGIGMALDALRGEMIDMAGISRLPNSLALKQAQSTGMDRFMAVVCGTVEGESWAPRERFLQCAALLESDPTEAAFVSPDAVDRREVTELGAQVFVAGWHPGAEGEEAVIAVPGEMLGAFQRRWAGRG